LLRKVMRLPACAQVVAGSDPSPRREGGGALGLKKGPVRVLRHGVGAVGWRVRGWRTGGG